MRVRYWLLIAVALFALGLSGCAPRAARVSRETPVPTKTLRPTFTATIPKATLTPSPTPAESGTAAQPAGDQAAAPAAAPTVEPTPTAEPTAEPSPTPAAAAFTVTSASINVRSGPGTVFPVIGRLTNGQNYPISGKNADGTWWQFDYSGKPGWVIGTNVAVTSEDAVQLARNIPSAPPTARPQPTARPAAPRPAQPAQPQPAPQPQPQPQAAVKYGLTGKAQLRPNTNPWVTVWCLVANPDFSSLVAGTLRVQSNGATVKEIEFGGGKQPATGDPGIAGSEYLYNPGCKAELPAADGTYTAYLIEGGNQVSDVYTFTVAGEANRTAIIEWKQR